MADIFICYSTIHPVYAYMIEDYLKTDTNYSWFRDQLGLRPAELWQPQLTAEIYNATLLIVIVTRQALDSAEVQREVALALSLNKPCVSVVMERFDDVGTKLRGLNLDDRQAIKFFEGELVGKFRQLSDALKLLTDRWAPTQRNIDRLGHFSWKVRKEAVVALGATHDKRVLDSLVEAFEVEDSSHVKAEIAHQMEDFDDQRAIDIILSPSEHWSLTSPDSKQEDIVRRLIDKSPLLDIYWIEGLGRITDERQKLNMALQYCQYDSESIREVGFDTMVSLASSSEDVQIRSHGKYLLTLCGHPRAKQALEKMLENENNPTVRGYIQEQIDAIQRRGHFA